MNEQQKAETRVPVMSLFVSMMTTTMMYQLKQRNIGDMVSTWKLFAVFLLHQLSALLQVYDSNDSMVIAYLVVRVLAWLGTAYIAGKHVYITLCASVGQHDWHESCRLLTFDILVLLMILSGVIVQSAHPGSVSSRQDPSQNTGYAFLVYVSVTLMSLVVANDDSICHLWALEQKLDDKQKFIALFSHEVRTPLYASALGIQMAKDVLTRGGPTKACITETQDILVEVMETCRQTIDMVKNLPLFMKNNSMELPLEKKRGDLGTVCSKVISKFQPLSREVSLELDIHESLLLTPASEDGTTVMISTAISMFDESKIVNVFSNLVTNAIRVTPRDGNVSLSIIPVSLTELSMGKKANSTGFVQRVLRACRTMYGNLRVHASSWGGYSTGDGGIDAREVVVYLSPASPANTTHYRVILSDTGPGLSPQYLSRLMALQSQTATPANIGLGLFASYRILSQHGLELQVYSDGVAGTGGAVGGTHFYVDFPVCAVSEASSEGDSNGNNMGGADDSGESGRWVGCLRGCLRKNRETEVDVFEDDNNDDITIGRMEATDIPSNIVTATTSSNLLTGGDEAAALVPAKRAASRLRRTSSIRNRELTDLSILIVDDSVINRKMVTRTLRQNCIGSIIEGVGDGTELLTLLGVGASSKLEEEFDYDLDSDDNENKDVSSNDTYDVILLDDHMTYMDGSVAARKLRRCGYKGLIIGVTGSATDEDMQAFCEAGVDFALPKPLVLKELQQLLISQL
eukprot:CAMPEP_0114414994 /NCGR_PEP_ID=MMETSP0103-20121206/1681_1 /TAXON_ID=37642 ORGANISM="Paraphysomonas imperforata, Strain PA2" /NCGR_SAMPLE_ID=MMETSP0103 /ASSEMBLY_ACC=CAM_ASM_000201 /LENGTH=743 /DNA_ID=CAMNT_0001583165 /DNA_START=394 /DNA_END=2625 /DNA_ORIENTATION=-